MESSIKFNFFVISRESIPKQKSKIIEYINQQYNKDFPLESVLMVEDSTGDLIEIEDTLTELIKFLGNSGSLKLFINSNLLLNNSTIIKNESVMVNGNKLLNTIYIANYEYKEEVEENKDPLDSLFDNSTSVNQSEYIGNATMYKKMEIKNGQNSDEEEAKDQNECFMLLYKSYINEVTSMIADKTVLNCSLFENQMERFFTNPNLFKIAKDFSYGNMLISKNNLNYVHLMITDIIKLFNSTIESLKKNEISNNRVMIEEIIPRIDNKNNNSIIRGKKEVYNEGSVLSHNDMSFLKVDIVNNRVKDGENNPENRIKSLELELKSINDKAYSMNTEFLNFLVEINKIYKSPQIKFNFNPNNLDSFKSNIWDLYKLICLTINNINTNSYAEKHIPIGS